MAVATDILIQIPARRKKITGDPLTGIIKYHLEEETVYKEVNLELVQKQSGTWYQYVHKYRVKQEHPARERTKVGNQHNLEDHKTYVLMNVKLLNKNPVNNLTSSTRSLQSEVTESDAGAEEIKRYHVEIKFKKPTGIFCLNKTFKAIIKIYPTVVSPFPDDPFMSALDKTLTQLFSSKKHEINIKAELENGCISPSREFNVSFVVANNTDVIISLKTVSKMKT